MITYFFLSVILFVLFTPGIVVNLAFSKNTKKEVVALIHGVLFSIVWLSICYLLKHNKKKEGFLSKTDKKKKEEVDETEETKEGLEESSSKNTNSKSIDEISGGTISKNTVSKLTNGDISIQNFNPNNIVSLSGGNMINVIIPSLTADNICSLIKSGTN